MGMLSCRMPFWHSIVDPFGELLLPFLHGSGPGGPGGPGGGPGGGPAPPGGPKGQLKSHGGLKCGMPTRQSEMGVEGYVVASWTCSAGVMGGTTLPSAIALAGFPLPSMSIFAEPLVMFRIL